MLRVTIDIFSGRQNPSWIIDGDEAALILREIARHHSVVGDPTRQSSKLGYRGMVLELLNGQTPQTHDLPPVFSIADGTSHLEAKGVEIAQALIDTAPFEDPAVGALSDDADVRTVADARKFFTRQLASGTHPAATVNPRPDELPPVALLPALSNHETMPFAAEFWNAPSHLRRNNCYAYAADRRTDTFPQPGRGSGREAASFTFEEIAEAAGRDGAVSAEAGMDASEAPRHLVALFIWPGHDYHWYRLHSDGCWGHKPGPAPAGTVDNIGTRILDPRVCSRASYSDFAGFFLIPKTLKIR